MPRLTGSVRGAGGVYLFSDASGVFTISNIGTAISSSQSGGGGHALNFDSQLGFPRSGIEVAPVWVTIVAYLSF